MKFRILAKLTGKQFLYIILLFISRTFTHEELLEQAEKNFVKVRNQYIEDNHNLLVPHIHGIWGSNAPVNKETITRKVAKENPKRNHPQRDEKMLKAFLDNINPKVLEIPDLVRNEDLLQTGTTVLDMVRCLQNKETMIYNPDRNSAATRKDLVRSIKTYTVNGKVSKYCPSKLKDFLALLDRNPTIMYGGPRFLHSARQKMIFQYAILKATAVPFEKDLFERELQAEEKQYLRCGHKGIRECNHWEPVDIIDWKKSLSIHPKLAPKRFRINMDELSIDHLLREASFRERGIREGVFEFFRMNMKLIDVFFDACNEDSVFGRTYRKFYEKLRLIDRTETRARIMSFIYADQQPDPSGLTPVKRYRERRTMRERSRSRSRPRESPDRKRPRGATLEEKVREHDQEEQLVVLQEELQVEEDPGEGTSRGPRERTYSYDEQQPVLLNEALIHSDESDDDNGD